MTAIRHLPYQMAQRTSATDGFTLLEMMVVMACLSVMALIAIPAVTFEADEMVWPYRYLAAQAEAIRNSESTEMEDEEGYAGACISFDEKGYIPQAGTIHFEKDDIVMELGGGRLVFRKRTSHP